LIVLQKCIDLFLTEEAKNEIYRQFNRSLNENGILFIGSTEQIIQCKEFGFVSPKSFFIKK
jgi:chemotaxis protein methyltransferase CheR